MAASECNRRIGQSVLCNPSNGALHAHCALIGPENKATALLITHRRRSDTCRKPGTAFTTEYQMPGEDVRTSVAQKCSLI
eukprot:5095960-Amphidinium_carterae.1